MINLAIAWSGLPDYGARCIRAVIEREVANVTVIATRPQVPIQGMSESLGQEVKWIDGSNRSLRWRHLEMDLPDIFIQGGYFVRAFSALGRQCRKENVPVVLMSDQNWRGTIRQRTFDVLRFRLFMRYRFSAVLVPGESGADYHRRMGMTEDLIFQGFYGADPRLFGPGQPLLKRSKTFLFVGQLIPRKNVLGLCRAFVTFSKSHSDWTLRICGNGPLRHQLPQHPNVEVLDFIQPSELSGLMREARCLVLPSRSENWGLVVHEAVLSGCALALSDVVGAAADFARSENALIFKAGDESGILLALERIASWDARRWRIAEETSLELARNFGPTRFADSVVKITKNLLQ